MHAVVGLLDPNTDRLIRETWRDLAQTFDLRVQITHPHLTLHVADDYVWDALYAALAAFCDAEPAFAVQTVGLGLFTGESPVLFVNVRPTVSLLGLHQRLADLCTPLCTQPYVLYTPARWVPHVTIVDRALSPAQVGPVVGHLAPQPWTGPIAIDRLAVMRADDGVNYVETATFSLRAAAAGAAAS